MKIINDYEKEYGLISKDKSERLDKFLEEHSLHRYKKSVLDEMHRINSITWNKFSFTLYLVPSATPRPRYCGKGNFFYVKGAGDNKKLFKYLVESEDVPFIYTACKVDIKSYFPIPNGMHPIDQILAEMGYIRPISKPDFDNVAKTYCDMITGVILSDDCIIIEGNSSKYYSWKPRIEMTIEYMNDFDCEYNKKKCIKNDKK